MRWAKMLYSQEKYDKNFLAPLKSTKTSLIKNLKFLIQVGIKDVLIKVLKQVGIVYDNQTTRQIIPTVKTYYGICWEIAIIFIHTEILASNFTMFDPYFGR